VAEIEVSKVKVAKNRKARPEAVEALVDSIREIGLLNPIILDDENNLIAGLHRLEATKKLGERVIEFRRSDLDILGRELARIDENLCRNQMTALERIEATDDRREIWDQMHPEAKEASRPGPKPRNKKVKVGDPEIVSGFAKDTAKKTGTTDRSVRQHMQAAKGLDTEAKMIIREIPAAKSPGVTELMKLGRLAPEKQREIATQVAKTGETMKAATRSLLRREQVAQVRVYQPPTGAFAVISCDPPWKFEDELDGSDAARGGCPYPPMELAEICALKIPAADDCVLWLWVTNTHLIDGSATKALNAWGFEPKTLLTWDKMRIGTGHWLRNVTEHCILAVKGKPVVEGASQSTLFQAPRGEHSTKPDAFYALVEKLCPSPSRIEMFSRAEREGWVTTGAELPKKRGRAEVEDFNLSEAEGARLAEGLKKFEALPEPKKPRKPKLRIPDEADGGEAA
jgi:N6-adenosine-specific RNA methylase IME4